MIKRMLFRNVLLHIAMVLISVLTACIMAEVAYRIRLAAIIVDPPPSSISAMFGAQDQSLWEFDREFGYVYPPARTVTMFWVGPDGILGCDSLAVNAYGNMGRIKGDYASASLKLLVFGDSFSAISFDGMTWPDYLQDRLEERLGRSVHVVNFGRDGYGILQMFDLARAKIMEWRPNVVIFAFTTDDLTRARFWRTVVEVDGLTRVLTTMKPDPRPAISKTADTYVLYPPATPEWCKAIQKTGRRDHHVEAVERVYHRIQRDRSARFDPFVLDRSYLYQRLRYGKPTLTLLNPSQNPRHQLDDFLDDEQFRSAVAVVEAQSVPYLLVHLPFYPEYVSNQSLMNDQESHLLKSLERATGHPIVSMLDPGGSPVANPDRLHNGETDMHPSPEGQKLYAEQVSELLIRKLNLH